jgi:hypothetical protein
MLGVRIIWPGVRDVLHWAMVCEVQMRYIGVDVSKLEGVRPGSACCLSFPVSVLIAES